MNKPLQIGITGGIGSGKSFVCSIFKKLGIPIYDADSRAKWLMANDENVKSQVIAAFGAKSYDENGLNRQYLAAEVFNSSDRIKQLNAIVHPAVGSDYKNWVEANYNQPYLIKEAALMFESGSYRHLDAVIYVHAPSKLRKERVLKRDPQRTPSEIDAIIGKQLSEQELTERSDYIIYNDETKMLLPQIINLNEQFKNRELASQ
ncbi:dephospho-CoA kinase [Fulvivirga sp. RKSG066]|uniref:dephospho-CoA kinase n=1 Tax=Fulvivirga aurantia TaxID=2529383 RepID=UPI0012BC74F5|nr:dephospho-CoA kinase [Fulvivirga aurantia]MTI20082.1 dephospho-CoA kinase [Fulvivirga aurantia]